MQLNQHSPIPLYRQLADQISGEIDTGVHPVDTKIPSENELAARYRIGRPTVRQATDLLVRQGRLERRRGSGTYVLPPTRSIDLLSLAGTSAALQKSDLNTQLALVGEPVREKLTANEQHPDTGNDEHFRIERRASVDDVPVLYETLWFNAALFPGLDNQILKDKSLSALVRDVYFLEPSSADQTFSVIHADAHQAKQLSTSAGTALLRVYRQLHFGDNRNALHAEILCLTDRFAFSQTLFPTTAADKVSDTTTKQPS